MSETLFTIGARVSCRDGDCGDVLRVVVDPVAQKLTHLVVEPKHRSGLGKLVPLELVESTHDDVLLRCSLEEFEKLDAAEETDYLAGTNGYLGYSASEVFPLPYYGLSAGSAPLPVVYDKVPLGEVAVRRGDSVHASDGEIGRVQGLVIDPSDHHVTHVLLQEGHLWGKEEIAVPVSAVVSMRDGIRLRLTKQEVHDLEPVDLDAF